MKTILPGKTIGIIGGGQLGRMLAMSAKEMGYKIAILDPSKDCCSRLFADIFIESSFNDFEKLEELCKLSDVITFEFENIDADNLNKLKGKYNIVQDPEFLKITQNRFLEKEFAKKLGIPTVKYINISDIIPNDIEIDKEYLMKTTRFGYDGKGQKKISSKSEIETNCILEEIVKLDKEISVVAVKDVKGIEIIAVVENKHVKNILYKSKIPTTATKSQELKAIEYTRKILSNIDYFGVLTVEFFISDDEVIFNEIAPRVHNSGHITMQSARKSQFRAHIEAISGLSVGKIDNVETTMYNILGQDLEFYLNNINKFEGFLHLYEKEPRENRKVGHINFYGDINIER